MTPEELREEVRAAALKFTQDVANIFAEAFASAASAFVEESGTATATPKRAVAKPTNNKASNESAASAAATSTPANAPKKRVRRSAKQLNEAADRLYNYLKEQSEPQRIETINQHLGTSTKELMRPIHKLVNEGKIVKSGERRATKYAVAPSQQ